MAPFEGGGAQFAWNVSHYVSGKESFWGLMSYGSDLMIVRNANTQRLELLNRAGIKRLEKIARRRTAFSSRRPSPLRCRFFFATDLCAEKKGPSNRMNGRQGLMVGGPVRWLDLFLPLGLRLGWLVLDTTICR